MTATPVVLALASAIGYGAGDFLGGEGSRRTSPAQMSLLVQCTGLIVAGCAVAITAHGSPPTRVIAWGVISGLGSAVGNQALYRGLASGAMNVVAPLSAVLAAVLPAVVGLVAGERLSLIGWVGLSAALPAIVLVSLSPAQTSSAAVTDVGPTGGGMSEPRPPRVQNQTGRRMRAGVGWGLLAGCGFGLLFVGLDKAGTGSGAWPLLLDQVVAVILVGAVHARARHRAPAAVRRASWSRALPWGLASGVSGTAGNILFFVATGTGPLTVVAVLSSLYPAITVILAAVLLGEKTGRGQLVGLLIAAVAVGLVTSA